VQGAVLALVVRQQNTCLWRRSRSSGTRDPLEVQASLEAHNLDVEQVAFLEVLGCWALTEQQRETACLAKRGKEDAVN